jgi:hypothetical protein
MNAPRHRHSIPLLLLVVALEACATTETVQTPPAATAQRTEPRRRRRRVRRAPPAEAVAAASTDAPTDGASPEAAAASDPAAPEGTGSSIGSPVVATAAPRPIRARWREIEGRRFVLCDGAEQYPVARCGQCPATPESVAVERAFQQAEASVLACTPPANLQGLLAVRTQFSAAGVPLEVSFQGVDVERRVALCMGRALCRVRVPTFRQNEATVNYEYVVLTTAEGP